MTQIKTEMRRDLPPAVLNQLSPKNSAQVLELLTDDRPENRALVAWADGELLGLAIIGIDRAGMVTVYFARSFLTGLGPPALRAFLGAAQLTGRPFRVHADKISAMARSLGLEPGDWLEGSDSDGVKMLVVGPENGQ